jgi:hypothetical protein
MLLMYHWFLAYVSFKVHEIKYCVKLKVTVTNVTATAGTGILSVHLF